MEGTQDASEPMSRQVLKGNAMCGKGARRAQSLVAMERLVQWQGIVAAGEPGHSMPCQHDVSRVTGREWAQHWRIRRCQCGRPSPSVYEAFCDSMSTRGCVVIRVGVLPGTMGGVHDPVMHQHAKCI